MSYKLRITIPHTEESIHQIKTFLSKYSTQWIYVLEKSKQQVEHIHFFFKSVSVKERAIRMYLSKIFGKGNKVYSLKELDEEYPISYLAYLYKDGKPVESSNFPSEIIEEAKTLQVEIEEDIKLKKPKNMAEAVIREYLPPDHIIFTKHQDLYWYKEYLYNCVIKMHVDKGLMIKEFQIVSIMQTILLRYSDLYRDKIFQKQIFSRLENKFL